MGLAPFLLMLFSLLVVAFVCHHSHLCGPGGVRLSFSCSSPCLLWLLLATIHAYLAHGAGAFPSPAFLHVYCGFYLPPFAPIWPPGLAPFLLMLFSSSCGFCLPPFAPIWPTGLAPFLLLLFSLLVVAFTCHHSRLFGPWGWRLSFSCSSPELWPLLVTIRAYLSHGAGAFPCHAVLPACCGFLFFATTCAYLAHGAGAFPSPCLLWLLLATIRAYVARGAGAFPSPALPLPALWLLFATTRAGPWGWRLSFSCSFPCWLWPIIATFPAYLAHGGWRLSFSCFSPCLLWLFLAYWAGAFPSPAFLPAYCGFYLPPFAPSWPMGLAPFLLLLFSPFVVAFACHHLRLFGPLAPAFLPSCCGFLLATTCAYLAHGAGTFPSPALLLACCGFCLPPFAPIWPPGLAPFLLMLFSSSCGFCLPPFAPIWPTGLAPFLLLHFSLLVVAFYLPPSAPIWLMGLAPFLLMLFPLRCGFYLPPFAPIRPMGLAPFLLMLFSLLVVAINCYLSRLFGPWGWCFSFSCSSPCLLWLLFATIRAYLAHGAGAFPSPAFLPAYCGFFLPPCAPVWPTGLAPFLLLLFSLLVAAFACHHSRLVGPWGLALFLLMFFCLLVVAFSCHHVRLFGPWGWRLFFSCFSPCLLWRLLAHLRLFGPLGWCLSFSLCGHWANSCPSLAIALALSSSFCATFRAYCFAPWSGAHVRSLFLILAAVPVSHFLSCSWLERPFWWYSSPFRSPWLLCLGMLLYLFVLHSNPLSCCVMGHLGQV